MGFTIGRFRAGDGASPAAGGGDDPSQGFFRASDVAAPTTPALPITPPSPGTRIGMPISAREALLLWDLIPPGASPPPGKIFAPVDTDWSWRWLKHHPTLTPEPGPNPYISFSPDGVLVEQAPIASGGGSFIGDATPYMDFDSVADGLLVDHFAVPIWTIAVSWDTLGPVQLDGTPPATTSSAPTLPTTPTLTDQPIIGNIFTNGPWLLYLRWDAEWVGGPGDWTLQLNERLVLSYNAGGGATTLQFSAAPGGVTAVELDNTHNRIRCSPDPSLHLDTIAGDPGGWPGSQAFGASTMSPNSSPSFRHFNGHIRAISVVGQTLEETIALLSTRSVVPGTGPAAPVLRFRAADAVSSGLSARLSTYAHYWPLDDAAGPMLDLVTGVALDVVNPAYATFRVDGIVDPLSPDHTKAIRLDRASNSGTAISAYLEWGGAGPRPSIGTGAVGNDLTIGCWIKWEGPPPDTDGNISVVKGGLVPFGFANVPSLNAKIVHETEPFGVELETFDHGGSVFDTIDSSGFDWPADYALDYGDPLFPYVVPIPYKAATWAQLVIVMRTVAGHMTQESWVDGVLVASGPGPDSGWGVNVALYQVALNLAPCLLQHLTIWPFALSAAEIGGIA